MTAEELNQLSEDEMLKLQQQKEQARQKQLANIVSFNDIHCLW
jgi:hypothetical protein